MLLENELPSIIMALKALEDYPVTPVTNNGTHRSTVHSLVPPYSTNLHSNSKHWLIKQALCVCSKALDSIVNRATEYLIFWQYAYSCSDLSLANLADNLSSLKMQIDQLCSNNFKARIDWLENEFRFSSLYKPFVLSIHALCSNFSDRNGIVNVVDTNGSRRMHVKWLSQRYAVRRAGREIIIYDLSQLRPGEKYTDKYENIEIEFELGQTVQLLSKQLIEIGLTCSQFAEDLTEKVKGVTD